MHTNPVLSKLGFGEDDRLVIVHTDDIGMCQASVAAFADLMDAGIISSGAVMTPCSWFPAAAAYCRTHSLVDMGVHITLNSEWDAYRWGPLSTRGQSTGLVDEAGYMHRSSAVVQEKAEPEAVRIEMQMQLDKALSAGIDVTHIDTHMGTVGHLKFIPAYVQLAIEYHLPPMILRMDPAGYEGIGLSPDAASFAAQFVGILEEQGVPLIDSITGLRLDQPQNRMEQAKAALAGLLPGITHFVIHPAIDTPELRAITPDWASRVGDYQIFTNKELRKFIAQLGIQVIGYRALRNLMQRQH
jgi:hypothetical protein